MQIAEWAREQPVLVGLIGLVILGIVAVAVVGLYESWRSKRLLAKLPSTDPQTLERLAITDKSDDVRYAAIERITDSARLANIAKTATFEPIRDKVPWPSRRWMLTKRSSRESPQTMPLGAFDRRRRRAYQALAAFSCAW